MRKAIIAIFALAAVGSAQPTPVSAHGGFGGYPANFGSNYAQATDCHLVAHRVMTRHGWRIRRVQVCS
jgi:hypothetical protein